MSGLAPYRTEQVFSLACRLLLASAFLFSGATKLLDFSGGTSEVRALTGFETAEPVAMLVIATQLGGSVLLVAGGRAAIIGAVLLAGFTLAATALGHPFWAREGVAASRDATTFLEHLGLVGGLALAAAFELNRRERTA